jgi:hypothetical protein
VDGMNSDGAIVSVTVESKELAGVSSGLPATSGVSTRVDSNDSVKVSTSISNNVIAIDSVRVSKKVSVNVS